MGAFGLSSLITGLASLITIPIVISVTGEAGWAAVAVGQALGSIIAVFTTLGWLQAGPADVARSGADLAGKLYRDSLVVRGFAYALLLLPAWPLSALLGTPSVGATYMVALAMMATGIGATWFYVGEKQPYRVLWLDAVPRVLGIASGSIALLFWPSVEVYAALYLLGHLSAALLSATDILRRYPTHCYRLPSPAACRAMLMRHKHGTATALLTSVYGALPLLILQAVSPTGVALFALADRIKQQAVTAYRPVSQAAQGWVPRLKENETVDRARFAASMSLATGALVAITSSVLMGPVSRILGGGEIYVPLTVAIPTSIALGSSVVSLTVGVACLVPLGLEKHITRSAGIGTLVVLILILPASIWLSAVGVACVVAIAQVGVASYQVWSFARYLRRRNRGQ